MEINLNEEVKVMLTEFGEECIRKYWDQYRCDPPDSNIPDEHGYITIPIWEMMNIFGPHMYMGNNKMPIYMNVELFREK